MTGPLLLLALQASTSPAPLDLLSEHYSNETRQSYEAYLVCFATGGWARRNRREAPVALLAEAKAECRDRYNRFVEWVVHDDRASIGEAGAAARGRAALDQMDGRLLSTFTRVQR